MGTVRTPRGGPGTAELKRRTVDSPASREATKGRAADTADGVATPVDVLERTEPARSSSTLGTPGAPARTGPALPLGTSAGLSSREADLRTWAAGAPPVGAAPATQGPEDHRAARAAIELSRGTPVMVRLPHAVTFLGGQQLDVGDPALALVRGVCERLAKGGVATRVGEAGQMAGAVAAGVLAANPEAEVQGVLREGADVLERPLDGVRVHERVIDRAVHAALLTQGSEAYVVVAGEPLDVVVGELAGLLRAMEDGSAAKRPVIVVGAPLVEVLEAAKAGAAATGIDLPPAALDVVVVARDVGALEVALAPIREKAQAAPSVEAPYASDAALLASSDGGMRTPPGPVLSAWMRGDVVGKNRLTPPVAPQKDDAARAEAAVPPALLHTLRGGGVPDAVLRAVLDEGVSPERLAALVDLGAGRHAIELLHYALPYCPYRPPDEIVAMVLLRWGAKAEAVFERLNLLSRSTHLENPDELKSWYMGIASENVAADGYATMVNDAVDLLEAGHRVAIERRADGLGDVIDVTTRVVYQHKRVVGRHLGANLKKAVQQLAGFGDVPGAPPGFLGVVQLDVRQNPSFTWPEAEERIVRIVASLKLEDPSRLCEIQIVLDDRLLVFGPDQALKRRVLADGPVGRIAP